jgi:hypothetical protein
MEEPKDQDNSINREFPLKEQLEKIPKRRIVLIAAIFLLAVFLISFFFGGSKLSNNQKEIIELFGKPEQFSITYLPQDEGDKLARSEIWYYAKAGKKISFLAGKLLAMEDFQAQNPATPTALNSEDFDIAMNFNDVKGALGGEIAEFDWPGFSSDRYKTYLSDKALFSVEGDALIYFQTIGLNKI